MISQHDSILMGNYYGAASSGFYYTCKQYVDMYRPSILLITETRCDPNKLKKEFQLLGFDGWHYPDFRGYARGIMVAW